MMRTLRTETALLSEIGELNSHFLDRVREFIDAAPLRGLAATFTANVEKRKVDLGFNPFALVSDVYHRENFHSDILTAIIDPHGAHKQGALFLRLFLEFLRDHHGIDIDPDEYRHAQVARESARIDILIWDEFSGKAIIVENKINGAGDMDRQVVRYLEEVEGANRKLKCEAIVYLTLLQKKTPDRCGWTSDEVERADPLLRPMCAYQESGSSDDLYHGWLKTCEEAGAPDEVTQVIHHYQQIILKLGQNAMNQPLMEEFYELVKDAERHQAALSLTAIMKDLSAFRCQRLMERFRDRHQPFGKIWPYGTSTAVLEGFPLEAGRQLKIHIDTNSQTETVVSFWDNAGDSAKLPREILEKINLNNEFKDCSNGWPSKRFAFPSSEEELYLFIDGFLQKLRDYAAPAKAPAINID